MKFCKAHYNCYTDNKGYILPKSPVIKLTSDIIEWLSTDANVRRMFVNKPNTKGLDKEWLEIGISHSYVGNVYASAWSWSEEEFNKYLISNPYIIVFDDYDKFQKYMRWVAKLGPWFTKQELKTKK